MMGITEYQERRRKAVSESIPRLAFVTSDVVCFFIYFIIFILFLFFIFY